MKNLKFLVLIPLVVLASVILLFTASIVYRQLDPILFPSLSLKIDKVTEVDSGFVLGGTIHKYRECEVIDITAYLSNSKIFNKPHKIDFSNDGFILGPAITNQRFDDWLIKADTIIPTNITIYARYKCSPLWPTSVKLDEFTVDYSNGMLDVSRYSSMNDDKSFIFKK